MSIFSRVFQTTKLSFLSRISEAKLLRTLDHDSVALVGSRKYCHLDLGPVIDSFSSIIRFNLGMPGLMYGKSDGYLCLNSHLWQFFLSRNPTLEAFHKKYSELCDTQYLTDFYNYYSRERQTSFFHIRTVLRRNIEFLDSIGYPFDVSYFPRVGINALLYLLANHPSKPFLFGFSIDTQSRTSFYQSQNRISNERLHSSTEESALLLWLAEKDLIDISFCLLEDTSPCLFGHAHSHLISDTSKKLLLKLM